MSARHMSEIDLLQASLRGSAQAFSVVVAEYQSLVCAITYSATGNVEKSEELAQEVFLKAWKSLGQLQDLSRFRAWLCQIARNALKNWYRRQKRDVMAKAAPLDQAVDRASRESSPEEAAMVKELHAVVNRALAEMPETLREPLILFYREQKSGREVARQLGLSETAARQRVSRGRGMLREQVAGMIETTIADTKPGKAFTTAVIASITTIAVKNGAVAAAAHSAKGSSLSIATALSGATAKIVALAAGLAIVGGAVLIHTRSKTPDTVADAPATTHVAEPQASAQDRSVRSTNDTADVVQTSAESGLPRSEASATAPDVQTTPGESALASTGRARTVRPAEADAEPSEFEPKGVLSGLVTDSTTGEPVRDALIRIELSGRLESHTDANGFYSFDKVHRPGSHRVWILSKEYVGITIGQKPLAVHVAGDKQAVRHFQLPKACMVDLWVTDANSAPIENARIVTTSLADSIPYEVGYAGNRRDTDPNGYFMIGGIPPADTDYLITAWHQADQSYDYAPARAVLRLDDPNVVAQVRITLEKGEEVHGYAEYADGVPAKDVGIVARPAWWHCNYGVNHHNVDADGLFTLPHVTPGTYNICMYIPRPDGSGGTVSGVMEAQLPPANGEPLVVRLPQRSPQSLASISGTIVFLGAKKPNNVSISAYSPTGGRGFTHVGRGRNGELEDTFVLDRLEPGTYRLSFSGGNLEEKVLENIQAPSAGLQVELVYAAKPKLNGTVADGSTGEPIKSFKVRARKLRTLRGPNYVQEDEWALVENERGFFTLDVVGPGVYQVQVTAEGYAPIWSEEINTDEADPVDMSLTAGGRVTGRVVDEQGQAVSGGKVIALSKAGGVMPRTKDTFVSDDGATETVDGAFSLEHLPAGTETIKVTHPGYVATVVEGIPVVEGETTAGLEIILTSGGSVEGCVYDDKGAPLSNEVLYFQDASGYGGVGDEQAGRLGTAITDSKGFYRVSHLPEQLCYVKRADEGSRLGVVRRAVVPKNGTVMRLDFGGTPLVSGAIVIDGSPLADTRVLLGPTESPNFGAFRCYTMTDKHGAFVFSGAARGTHAVYYEQPGKRNDWLKMATVTVAETDVNLGAVGNVMSELLVTVNTPDSTDSAWPIEQVYISDREEPFAALLRTAQKPTSDGAPWRMENVEPGTYTLTVVRGDQLRWRQQITLAPDRGPWQVSLDLPKATARVSGHVRGASPNWIALWQDDKQVWTTARLADDGAFAVENLPPGRYLISADRAFLSGLPAVAEFMLTQGQDKSLEVDVSATSLEPQAFLVVQVVDERGRLRDDAEVRLDGPSGTAEPTRTVSGQYFFTASPQRHTLHVEVARYNEVTKEIVLTPFDMGTDKRQTVVVRLESR